MSLALFPAVSSPAEEELAKLPLPKPGGAFGVGTVLWHWPDPARPDEITPQPGDVREVLAQAWYPSDNRATEPTGVYAPLDREITQATGWSQPGAPFTAKLAKAPVIALCPGSATPRYYYTSLAEDLASHGYVVLAVDSPHLGVLLYPDGRSLEATVVPPPELRSGPWERLDHFWEAPTALGTGDVLFALESLERIGAADPARRLTGKLDWTRLGAFGHSIGTRTCGGAVLADRRFAAFAAMDGPLPREGRRRGTDAALLLMVNETMAKWPIGRSIREAVPGRRNDVYSFILDGFGHLSVTDLPFLEPGKHPVTGGTVDPLAGLQRTREILRTFFDQYLKKTGPGLPSLAGKGWGKLESFPKPKGGGAGAVPARGR